MTVFIDIYALSKRKIKKKFRRIKKFTKLKTKFIHVFDLNLILRRFY